ncbi:dapper homolog 1 [Anolis carolinensis]|uniref:Dishevelled binding antagonist of beta catenin 1 n=1 Tax=Anolis carolinensis TaxID=28377 RepID=H9GLJ2_ANOCA|nr:PREDICTED: dapper homolog 1 [Anolis carolinensis]|eukprot:XP_008118503.1 PREDICTED: dapper homolog 1 [Anolis carolinensis]
MKAAPEAEALERARTRERLEATLAGLAELSFLRRRQELRVQRWMPAALPAQEAPSPAANAEGAAAAPRSLEEQFLEENILLLRRQLNCLRRRDAGLLNQLQELDKQISDLRLDVEKTADEHLETDSRPSSGFYELSDGTSGSLSNSSNSVFSECLSSCPSSTCFCSPLDASLNSSDGRPKSADLIGWLECNKGSQHEDQSAGMASSSPSTPHSNSLDVIADVHPKYQCDLVSKNGNDVYRYPSPLHAVAVQSPMFLLPVIGSPLREEEERSDGNTADVDAGAEPNSAKPGSPCLPHIPHSASCPTASRKMDSYILSLVQKRIPSVRTNKPRTNLNADPTKGILRHGSMCLRQVPGTALHNATTLKNLGQVFPPSGGTTAAIENGAFSPLKQHTKETEHQETKKMPPTNANNELQSKPPTRNVKSQEVARCPVVGKGDMGKESGQSIVACPKESPCRHGTLPKDNKATHVPKKILFKNSGVQVSCSIPLTQETRLPLDFKSEGSSSQSLEEAALVNGSYIPAEPQTSRLHKGSRSVKILKSSMAKHRSHLVTVMENGPLVAREKGKSMSKKCRFPDDSDTTKKPKKVAARGKKSSHLLPETGLLNRPPGGLKSGLRPHGHGREPVVAKPKHKRADYRRWKLSAEVSYEEALRRARRNRREAAGVYAQVPHPYASPYAYVASDSEYSAECESLFHSTVVDTSEDERSNYTTNCFGDSESSLSGVEFVGESTTTSDSDESGGLIWSQFVQTLPIQAVATASELHENAAKAFVKIKASHNLKKKILRFRSGSLKLMTTV